MQSTQDLVHGGPIHHGSLAGLPAPLPTTVQTSLYQPPSAGTMRCIRLAASNPSPRPRVTLGDVPRLRVLARQAGQGMTEYLIVVALIAVAAIGVYSLLGQTLRSQTAGLALEISGQDAGSAIGSARTQAGAAQASSATRKGLDNFNDGNR